MTYLVFCTANLDPAVIERFISQSTRDKSSTTTEWTLVRSPDSRSAVTGPPSSKAQEWRPEDHPGIPPDPPIPPFETGFVNATPEQLGNFVHAQVVNEFSQPDLPEHHRFLLSKSSFVVLDARSADDDTVLVYQRHTRTPRQSLGEIHEWVEWRVRSLVASFWCRAHDFSGDYADFEIGRDQYIDGEGVLQMPWYENMPGNFDDGLTDDEKAPWGPEPDPELEVDASRGEGEESESLTAVHEEVWLGLVESGRVRVYEIPPSASVS